MKKWKQISSQKSIKDEMKEISEFWGSQNLIMSNDRYVFSLDLKVGKYESWKQLQHGLF